MRAFVVVAMVASYATTKMPSRGVGRRAGPPPSAPASTSPTTRRMPSRRCRRSRRTLTPSRTGAASSSSWWGERLGVRIRLLQGKETREVGEDYHILTSVTILFDVMSRFIHITVHGHSDEAFYIRFLLLRKGKSSVDQAVDAPWTKKLPWRSHLATSDILPGKLDMSTIHRRSGIPKKEQAETYHDFAQQSSINPSL